MKNYLHYFLTISLVWAIILTLTSDKVYAQKGYLEVIGAVQQEGKGLQGADIKVYKGNEIVDNIITSNTGKYILNLDFNSIYTLSFSKKGLIKKSVLVDTKVPERIQDIIISYKFKIRLFPKVQGVDAGELLDKPVAKLAYFKSLDNFDYDREFHKQRQEELAEVKKKMDARSKELAEERRIARQDSIKRARAEQLAHLKAHELSKVEEEKKRKEEEDRRRAEAAAQAKLDAEALAKAEAERLQKIEEERARLAAEKEALAALNAKYDAALANGDKAFRDKSYEGALAFYEEAKELKPEEKTPIIKIENIERILAELQLKEEEDAKAREAAEKIRLEYDNFIASADAAFKLSDFETARTDYNAAASVIPSESYPKTQLAEIDRLIAEEEAKLLADKEAKKLAEKLDKEYAELISRADKEFEKKDHSIAKDSYREAARLKPEESYPINRIDEIDKILANEKAKEEAERAKQQEYARHIKEADRSFDEKSYETAISSYNAALGIIAEDKYATDRISESEKLMADAQAEEAAAAKLKEEQAKLQAQYDLLVADADKLRDADDWVSSKEKYNAASKILPEKNYPKEEIDKLDALIAADIKKKAEEDKARKDAEKLEQEYQSAIADADDLLSKEKYLEAKSSYSKAQSIKSDETYPSEKITEIEGILAKIKDDEAAAALEKEQAEILESDYKAAVEEADKAFKSKEYSEARTGYNTALKLKPEEKYPTSQIEQIDDIENKLATEAALEKDKAEKFAQFVKEGDELNSSKEYKDAIAKYESAVAIMSDAGVDAKIDKAKADLAQLLKDQEAEAAEQLAAEKLQKQYDDLIANADNSYAKKDLDNSVKDYNAALKLKPEESYPQAQIEKINRQIAEDKAALEAAEAERLANEKLEEDYNAAISEANRLFDSKKYPEAKSAYENALSLKADEKYPADQIKKIEGLLLELAAEQKKAEELEAKFDELMSQGNAAFSDENFSMAIVKYDGALKLKSDDPTATSKLEIAKTRLAEQQEADKLAEEAAAKEKAVQERYDAKIADADFKFNADEYQIAINMYKSALELKPAEQYPKEKISEAEAIIAAAALKKEEEEAKKRELQKIENDYREAITKADDLFNKKDYTASRISYEKAGVVKPAESYPGEQIARINQLVEEDRLATEKAAAEAEALRLKEAEAEKARLAAEAKKRAEAEELARKRKEAKLKAELEALAKQQEEEDRLKAEIAKLSAEERAKFDEEIRQQKLAADKAAAADAKLAESNALSKEEARKRAEKRRLELIAKQKAALTVIYDDVVKDIKEEEINESNRTVTKTTVTKPNKDIVYKKILYNWGKTFYFKDDISMSETQYTLDLRKARKSFEGK